MTNNTIVITNVNVKDNTFLILAKTPITPESLFTFVNDPSKSLTDNVSVALNELVKLLNNGNDTPIISVNIGFSSLTDNNIDIINEVYRIAKYGSNPTPIELRLHKHLVDSGVEVTAQYGNKSMKVIIPSGTPNPVTEIQKLLPELLEGGGGFSMYLKTLASEELNEKFPLKVIDHHISGTVSAGWVTLIESEQDDESEIPLDKLAATLFNPEIEYVPECQGTGVQSGPAGSSDYYLSIVHVLGNFFIEGRIGEVPVIITKNKEGVQCHSAPPYEAELLLTDKETLVSFSSHQEKDFLKWLNSLVD